MPAVCAKTSANSEPSIEGKAAQGLRQDVCAFSNAAVWRSSERLFLPQGTFLAWARPCTPLLPAARRGGEGGSQGNAGSPLCRSGCRRRFGGSGRTTICLLLVGPKVPSKGSLGTFDPSRLPGTPGGAFPATNPGLSGGGAGKAVLWEDPAWLRPVAVKNSSRQRHVQGSQQPSTPKRIVGVDYRSGLFLSGRPLGGSWTLAAFCPHFFFSRINTVSGCSTCSKGSGAGQESGARCRGPACLPFPAFRPCSPKFWSPARPLALRGPLVSSAGKPVLPAIPILSRRPWTLPLWDLSRAQALYRGLISDLGPAGGSSSRRAERATVYRALPVLLLQGLLGCDVQSGG